MAKQNMSIFGSKYLHTSNIFDFDKLPMYPTNITLGGKNNMFGDKNIMLDKADDGLYFPDILVPPFEDEYEENDDE